MAERILQMDDINLAIDPAGVTEIFRKLGYQILGQAIANPQTLSFTSVLIFPMKISQ